MLDSRPRGRGFEPHWRHCVVSLSKNINPSLVLVQPRKTRPFITERLLMGCKETNQTNKYSILRSFYSFLNWEWVDIWVPTRPGEITVCICIGRPYCPRGPINSYRSFWYFTYTNCRHIKHMHEGVWCQKYFDKITELYEDEYLVNFVSIRFNWGYDFDRSDQIKKYLCLG